jgi:lariat debranching enzyme
MHDFAVGGNHEASNHLWELYYGGWVAPNIYYLGGTGCIRFGGLRIAGLSGIFNQVCVTLKPFSNLIKTSCYWLLRATRLK